MPSSPSQRHQLRQQLRARRRALNPRQQQLAAQRVLARLKPLWPVRRCRRAAFYVANDGELDPARLLDWALETGMVCYLPALNPLGTNPLCFVRYRTGTPMRPNRYGIPEPVMQGRRERIRSRDLDLVFVPLVGFDERGGRLGMGGGYYDRSFCHKQSLEQQSSDSKPLLIGLAHGCQQLDRLPVASWDIPLDGVVTDAGIHAFTRSGRRLLVGPNSQT